MADGPLDRYEWDPNYFSTYDKVYEDLCREYGSPTVSEDRFGPTMLTFKEKDKIFLVYHAFFAGFHRVKCIEESKHVTYPISLPTDVEFKTLSPGDFLYRMRSDDEGRQENRRFYAERPTFKFRGIATKGYENGGVYRYKVKKPIRVVNFNRRWRSRIWGGDVNNAVGAYSFYESVLQNLCAEAGALGWRAAAWEDQREDVQAKKFLEADPEFEIVLFSSDLVESLDKIRVVDADSKMAATLRF
jgi:hypothetical protein